MTSLPPRSSPVRHFPGFCAIAFTMFAIGTAAPHSQAREGGASWNSRYLGIYSRPCALAADSDKEHNRGIFPLRLCLQGDLYAKAFALIPERAFAWAQEYGGKAGLYLGRRHSFHAEGQLYTQGSTATVARDTGTHIAEETRGKMRYGIYQWGRAAEIGWELNFGWQPLPFAFYRPIEHAFPHEWEPQGLWAESNLGIVGRWDDRQSRGFEMGIQTRPADGEILALSQRLMLDHSALGGTRLIVSAYEGRENDYRAGLALFNRSSRGAETLLQWVRTLPELGGNSRGPRQLLRFQVDGEKTKRHQTYFQFDEASKQYRLLILGHRVELRDFRRLGLVFSLFLRKGLVDPVGRMRWGFWLGAEAKL